MKPDRQDNNNRRELGTRAAARAVKPGRVSETDRRISDTDRRHAGYSGLIRRSGRGG